MDMIKTQPAPFRILHVAETAQGGLGSYLEEILPLQRKRYGSDGVRVVLPEEQCKFHPPLRSCTDCGYHAGDGRLANTMRMAREAWRVIHAWKPTVVHLHSTYAGAVMRPLLAMTPTRPRVVYCAHGWAFDRDGSTMQTQVISSVERWWSHLCDSIVCISNHDAHRASDIGIDVRRIALICNGIADRPATPEDHEATSVWPRGRTRVLFVGRLDRQKGMDVLYEAMQRLGDRAFCVAVGSAVVDGVDLAMRVNKPSNVYLTGWRTREQIAELYGSADVLVVPSRWEGFGLVALEAMRAGLAVVASRVGGLQNLVEDGATGLLFDNGDAQQLAWLLARTGRPAFRRMGAAGRDRYLREFQVERVVDELDKIYRP